MKVPKRERADGKRSEFIVYVDESGDHSLEKIDKHYPVFVLAFCAFYQENYIKNIVSALERLKFQKFGHDIVILHERDIRKEHGVFTFRDKAEKQEFIEGLTQIIEANNFILIACVIDKKKLAEDVGGGSNAYHAALGFCLETLMELLIEKGQQDTKTHIVFEKRGDKEDKELELEFRRICDGGNRFRQRLPFEIVLADKKVNSAGLQLADLVARPIGLNYLRPSQHNRAFEVLKEKFLCRGGRKNAGRDYDDWGLKVFPHPKSEKPR
ncbi:MAG: DUF3800 domain-containing protein [Parasphingopyxis sp.]